MFGAPLFQGCLDDERVHQPGAHRVSDHRFWVPLLLLTTGARLEEVGQLLVRDIREQDSILYIHVSDIAEEEDDPAKRVKTDSSRRRVPLHRIVLDAGFRQHLDIVVRAGSESLFPTLPLDGRGKRTQGFSKSFNGGFLNAVGITSRAKRLHSFRHLFKDRCREADLGEELHDALTGHFSGSVGRNYGAGFSLARLAGGMNRVEFPGFPGVRPPSSS
jgi:integrase